MSENEKKKKSKLYDILPLLVCGLTIPISIFMWLGNLAFSKFSHDDANPIPPTRWLFSILAPLLLMVYALKRRGVNRSGAVLGLILSIILSIANIAFLSSLATFFFSSSRATKFRAERKKKFDEHFKPGEGLRNWVQVLCNAGMATQLALLYLLDCGSGERPIDFSKQYRSSWLCIGVMSAFACSNGDTWASELGTVIGNSDPFLITTRKKVPCGTNGGVSIVGLLVSFFGGISIGLAYFLTVRYTVDSSILLQSPSQWPVILIGGLAGLIGSIVDSVIGATLQYSGIDEKGRIVERPGPNIRDICGRSILDNHSVNLISTIVTALLMPSIALAVWP